MNSAGVGSCSQTWGRKVARRPLAEKITPSTSGRNWARASASLAKDQRFGWGQEGDLDPGVRGNSSAFRGRKRGSWKAAAAALAQTSSARGAVSHQAADAAAQLVVLGQGDEGGAGLVQFWQLGDDRGRAAEMLGDGAAGQVEQGAAQGISHGWPPG